MTELPITSWKDAISVSLGTLIAFNYSAWLGAIPPLIGLITALVRWAHARQVRELRRENAELRAKLAEASGSFPQSKN